MQNDDIARAFALRRAGHPAWWPFAVAGGALLAVVLVLVGLARRARR